MVLDEEIIHLGKKYQVHYEDTDNFAGLPKGLCRQVYGVCFCQGKLVITYNGPKRIWGLTGGHIEPDEDFEQTLRREIKEEANMEIMEFKPIGWQRLEDSRGAYEYQLRYACKVRPRGPFVSDPASRIVKIALISPADYRQYFDWGAAADYMIKRAQKLMAVP